MRKYYQAALAIIAAVSVICLLFYRHEYNKLRYVLEVFNYFGRPNQKDIVTNCTDDSSVFTKFNMQWEEPFSSWQRIDDNLYVYSAYSIYDNEVEVIGVSSTSAVKDLQCIMLFENDVKPVLGTLNYVLINNTEFILNTQQELNYGAYQFHCTHTKNKVPIGITFLTKYTVNVNDAPVLAVKSQPRNLDYSNTAVCVVPSSTRDTSPLDMISFINFHDLIGMNNFIVYDNGMPNKLNSNMRKVSMTQSPYWKFTYNVLPWNFPFHGIDYSVMRKIIEVDCLYRTYNKAMYVTLLSWEEYIVMKYHHSIVDLMVDFNKSRLKADRYQLTALTFCTQQPSDTKYTNSSLTIFRKINFDRSIINSYPVYIYLPHNILTKSHIITHDLGEELVVLNRYKYCVGKTGLKGSVQDSSILRFMEDIQSSSIFKKFLAKNVFSLED